MTETAKLDKTMGEPQDQCIISEIPDTKAGFFFVISSSSKSLCSYGYMQFRFFDLTKNNLAHNIIYFRNDALGEKE
jgi:hypothetical protein